MYYTVKQIAEMMGMTEHAIRYYTDRDLLPCQRDGGNRRVFDDESINWLMGIKCLKGCGMSIEDIKHYGDLCLQGGDTLEERYQIMLKQRNIAEERLREAKEVYEYISKKTQHYKDIIDKRIPDDTNPNTRRLSDINLECE